MDFNSVQFFRRFLPAWSNDAACAGTDTNTFFPEDDRAANDDVVLKARVICARCPMRTPCLEWALDNPHSAEHGIYAGTTGEERKLAMKQGPGWVERLLGDEEQEEMA